MARWCIGKAGHNEPCYMGWTLAWTQVEVHEVRSEHEGTVALRSSLESLNLSQHDWQTVVTKTKPD